VIGLPPAKLTGRAADAALLSILNVSDLHVSFVPSPRGHQSIHNCLKLDLKYASRFVAGVPEEVSSDFLIFTGLVGEVLHQGFLLLKTAKIQMFSFTRV